MPPKRALHWDVRLRHEGFRRVCKARDLLREVREPSPYLIELDQPV